MGLVKINQIYPGMTLAEDLRDARGRFLMPGGAALTEKHIKVLKMWGIIEANVKGSVKESMPPPSEPDPLILDRAEKQIIPRFLHAGTDNAVNRELLRIAALKEAVDMQRRPGRRTDKPDSGEMPEESIDPIDFQRLTRRHLLELPTLPMLLFRINEIMAKPTSSANDIAAVISKDTALTARILRIVNSAFYGFPSRIDSVSRAVAIIGTRQLSMLASGISVVRMFRDIPSDMMDMDSFWRHSIGCGVHARIIASYHGIQNTERLFLSGLLHDIGRLILYSYEPRPARYAIVKARRIDSAVREVECEELGFDHAETGGMLLKRWKLPVLIEHAVRYHHTPQEAPYPLEPSILHMADIMTHAMAIGSSGERFVPPLDHYAWEGMGISVNALESIIRQADRQINEIFEFFCSGGCENSDEY